MAINFPSATDGTAQFGQPSGTSLLTSPDHAVLHDNLSSLGTVLESVFGTTPGTNILNPGIKAASDQLVGMNSGGTQNQTWTKGTANNFVMGSQSATGGTFTAPTINGLGTNSGTLTTGVYSSGTFGTPSVDTIAARVSGTGVGFSNSIYPAVGTWTDSAGGTLTPDARASQLYYSAMGTAAGNRTITTPTNPSNYQQLSFAYKTSGSANGTLVWGTAFRISQDYGTPLLGTGVGWNYYNWRYNAIDSRWDFIGQVLNLV